MRRLALICALVSFALITGCKASPPTKVEHDVIKWTKHTWTVGNKSERNPLPPTKENIASGKEAFSHYCVACHGMDGQNTGVPFADTVSPPVPLLSSSEIQSYTDGQLKWVIDNGIEPSGMPASRGILSDDEIWATVLFIRHLPPAGSLGDPPMYDK
jgi:mono/diheme cytochrome c family protein